ncbi:cobalt ABC transporter ATP-binding protein [Tessaracoccus aquimaris]|uniref:Cobalt ABC transporter ATP-binding protein n=1 Tax=Tessaracoccus aquimaris TaxID=1332264 RepID=A0A1Q2CNW4_9ACTN|nr:ABC transporter ATP-binding protein [Tessaracoccus aquimaris]AQP47784.1 cobalt ABC transporter ATP-binding protein [Tessaracoccus aquimaris]
MIEFDQVTITQPDATAPVLSGVTGVIRESDLCVIVGRTGTGKSTLLGAINALVPMTTGASMAGTVRVAGVDVTGRRPRDLADLIGYVGQNPLSGFVTDVVEDEIAYGMEQLGLDPVTMRKRVEETLDLMGIADLRRRALVELSGGQQQRVAIAAVLAAQPRVLVLDEPTSALDPTAAQDVLAAITTLVHDVGLTVVLAEHRLERVMHAADSAIWLPGDGRAVFGATAEVLGLSDVKPPLAQLSEALGWPTVATSVRDARRKVTAEGPHVALPDLPEASVSWLTDGLTTVARAERLAVHYGDLRAVCVDLDLHAGTVVALMGRNGSGKSSLLWALQGAVASTGTLTVDGADPRTVADAEARKLVSLVPQTPSDLLYLPTVGEELAQADRESDAAPGTTRRILADLGADLPEDRNPRDLSEGQRLALVLAIQLAARPAVICLDEPTRGLDYRMKAELSGIVRSLADAGACVVISTHDVEFAALTTDRCVILAEGEIVADGPTRTVCCASPAFSPQVAKVFHPHDVLTVAEVREAIAVQGLVS